MLEILCKNNDLWLKMAFDICKDRDLANDLVQDMYLKLHKINKQVNNSYVYFTIKSIYTDTLKNATVKNRVDCIDFNNSNFVILDHDLDLETLNEINQRIENLYNQFNKLRSHEKIIIEWSAIEGLRKFSRESNISIRTVQKCRTNLKEKVKASEMLLKQSQKPLELKSVTDAKTESNG